MDDDRHSAFSKELTTEDALRESEGRYRFLVEKSPMGIIVHTAQQIVFANPAAARIVGLNSPMDLFGRLALDFVHPEDRAMTAERMRQAFDKTLVQETIEERFLRPDGSVVHVAVRGGPVDWEGQPASQVIFHDITERKEAERLILEQDRRYRLATAAGRVGVWELYPEDMTLLSDGSLQALLGHEVREQGPVPLHKWEKTIPKEHRGRVLKAVNEIVEGRGQSFSVEYQSRRRDGSLAWVITKGRAILGPDGMPEQPLRVFGTTTDISETFELQEQLRQAQKMEAIGRLAGGIAHDFNNLLTGILGNASLGLGRVDPESLAHHNLEEVIYASKRAAELTQQLLAFSRRQMLDPRVLSINERVTRFRAMIGRIVGEDIRVELKLGSKVGPVRADPGQVEQILANLVVNARDAMLAGGTLTIKTTEVRVSPDEVSLYPGCVPGNYTVLSVRDTGHGMDEETRRQVFDPFFTTKPVGKGTGLGLSTVYGIVRQHDGFIEVRSVPMEGAVFEIYLPRVTEEPEDDIEDWADQRTPGQGESVLVVEDEEMVRELLQEVLALSGYEVQVAENAEVALEIIEAGKLDFDLLVTDVVMPGRQGGELAREVRRRYPDIKVLFVSGYTEDIIVRQGEMGKGARFIRKPFTPQELQVVVRELLDS